MKTKLNFFNLKIIVKMLSLLMLLFMLSFPNHSCQRDEEFMTQNTNFQLKSGSSNASILYWGHETFTRATGSPIVETRQVSNPDFSNYTNQFTLEINNGNGSNNKVSSAIIKIDGVQILGPSDFSQNVARISKSISNLTANSILSVELRGKPGGILDVWIEGVLNPGFALIGPQGGVLTSEDGLVTISFPSGAVENDKIVGIVDTTIAVPDVIIGEAIGKSYNLVPNGLHFEESLDLTWNYSNYILPSVSYENIAILHMSENVIDVIPTNNDLANHVLNFSLNSFSSLFSILTGQPWSVFNYHWVIPEIKWYLEIPSGASYLNSSNINWALNLWASKTSSFIFERTYDISEANIVFEETYTFSDDLLPSLVLALAPSLNGSVIYGRTIFNILTSTFQPSFDESVCGTIKIASTDIGSSQTARNVLAHEIGHAIGLAHCSKYNDQCVMNYRLAEPFYQLHTWDLAALYYHYEPNNDFQIDFMTDSRDGHVYQTIKIGDQWWMAENLQATKYSDGTSIPNVTNNGSWSNSTTGAYCWYNNDVSNKPIYGALYNSKAVFSSHGLSPEGWHIPSVDEWNELRDYLGGYYVAGGKLKETGYTHWAYPNVGATNESGFTALPGGRRDDDGSYLGIGIEGQWFSSFGWPSAVEIGYNGTSLHGYSFWLGTENYGLSVRCVKD